MSMTKAKAANVPSCFRELFRTKRKIDSRNSTTMSTIRFYWDKSSTVVRAND